MNTLIIRADATSEIGTGHVMRCLALAQAWQDEGGQAIFISHCESDVLRQRLTAEGFGFICLDKSHPDSSDLDFTLSTLNKLKAQNSTLKTWLAVDGYHFDADYQKSIKAAGYKLLWIDDYGHADHYYADLVLNQNISANPSLYINREPYTDLLLGTRYVLLRREFKLWQGWHRETSPVGRKVLVTMGGADPDNVTLKAIEALKQLDLPGLEGRIAIGPANPHLELLKKEIGDESRLHLLTDVADMPNLMAWADVSISAGGSTCWELAYMGVPCIIIITAENQRGNTEALGEKSIGINLGWPQDLSVDRITSPLKQLMMNSGMRSRMSQRGQNLIDGYGGQRLYRGLAEMGAGQDGVILERYDGT